jgi:membrane fusion protein, copper/silver efflux system
MNRIRSIAAIAAFAAFTTAPLLGGAPHPSLHGRITAFLVPVRKVEAAGQTNPGEGKILYYQDPMHPWYRSDKPGIAPDCGMKLVPVYASDVPAGALPPGGILISPTRQQLMGVTSAPAQFRTIDRVIHATGEVAIDETRISNVSTKVSGWVQKVFVDSTFQHVTKGEPLFTVYSPDLLAAEQEYLLALKACKMLGQSSLVEVSADGASLLEAARLKLSLLDVTADQTRDLEVTGKPQREVTIFSPAVGHVFERKVFPNQYVTPEAELYKIVDHTSMWIYAEVYESDIAYVSEGQQAVVTAEAFPGQRLTGRVSFVEPHMMEETRTERVRMEFPNPDLKLEPGMFVNVELHRGLGRRLTVPVDAVLDSGTHQRVFIDRGKGVFEPRTVTVGARSGDYAVILSGLRAGEHVVTRANFLIDSESNLRESIEGMQHDSSHH